MQMKIDTEKKEITVLETVTITDLLNGIALNCPNINPDEWKITGAYDNYFQQYIPKIEFPRDIFPQITYGEP